MGQIESRGAPVERVNSGKRLVDCLSMAHDPVALRPQHQGRRIFGYVKPSLSIPSHELGPTNANTAHPLCAPNHECARAINRQQVRVQVASHRKPPN